ncbi:MAG TPA: CaiB/BaiF CoA-transferase family protein, partial [Phototrophicaceae bacterium]|nr:CaiB/BaiF CoA-transferase family protein [Phototrophicaceae bacterium]
ALVYASITGFGQSGPYRDRPGYDNVIQAMSGLMSITGTADGEPLKVGVAVADVLTGMFALAGVLAALRQAEMTGQGQYLDFALLDCQLAGLVNVASNALVSGVTPGRYGNQHPNIVPYQTFTASDGDFMIAVGNDRQFTQLCQMIERGDLVTDPHFATNPQRVKNRAALIPLLQTIFITRPANFWVEQLVEFGIPAGPINTVTAALNDSHIRERNMVREISLTNGARLPYVASPLQSEGDVRYPPPMLGEHTEEILRDVMSMDHDAVEHYRATGVI